MAPYQQRPRLRNTRIRHYVIAKLKLGWSPEQIANRLEKDHYELHISYEAVYQYVYEPEQVLPSFWLVDRIAACESR